MEQQQKIVYRAYRIQKDRTQVVQTGQGYLMGTDLVLLHKSPKNKAFLKVWPDATKYCHPCIGKPNEFAGTYVWYCNKKRYAKNGSSELYESYEEYHIWYKFV